MKKFLILWAILLPLIFISCGDDKDDNFLVGEWIDVDSEPNGPEVFHYKFNSNHTGAFWVSYNGRVDYSNMYWTFKWSVDGDEITFSPASGKMCLSFVEFGTEHVVSTKYSLKNGVLHFSAGASGDSYRKIQ